MTGDRAVGQRTKQEFATDEVPPELGETCDRTPVSSKCTASRETLEPTFREETHRQRCRHLPLRRLSTSDSIRHISWTFRRTGHHHGTSPVSVVVLPVQLRSYPDHKERGSPVASGWTGRESGGLGSVGRVRGDHGELEGGARQLQTVPSVSSRGPPLGRRRVVPVESPQGGPVEGDRGRASRSEDGSLGTQEVSGPSPPQIVGVLAWGRETGRCYLW